MHWYQHPTNAIEKAFDTNGDIGLSHIEIEKRLKKYGQNRLPQKPKPSILFKFLSQFRSVLIIILLLATVLSAFLGELIDAIAIFAIIILNATIGTYQEQKAEKTLTELSEKDVPSSLVLRNKKLKKVPTLEIVPGDILVLEEGAKVPADGRIIESFNLTVDESLLTGESHTVLKISTQIKKDNVSLADQRNMVFKDTRIVAGRCKAVVTATGVATEIGKIALFLDEAVEQDSPLTKELNRVGHTLSIFIIIIALLIFLVTGLRGFSLFERILIAISLAVAAIPEGLPAIATITLSIGVERLARLKTIVKKLPSVETLGSVKIIATDKTGTLTENKLNVTDILLGSGTHISIEAEEYKTNGVFFDSTGREIDPRKNTQILQILTSCVIASNADIVQSGDFFSITGDTTEGALLIAASRASLSVDQIRATHQRIFEIPFSSERKMMSVVTKVDTTQDIILYSKGAPEVMLKRCNLTSEQQKKWQLKIHELANKGLRLIAVCTRKVSQEEVRNLLEKDTISEEEMEFLGIIGEKDNLRLEVADAIEKAARAGIRTIMITGDNLITASAIARDAGILVRDSQAITEEELGFLSRGEIANRIQKGVYTVFARVSPLGKLKLIESMKLIPNTNVAVTGDGVNDSPALKAADVGLAMGSGTDIAREVADMVISDDNYVTIIEAIKQGRVIFANLIKFVRYLISCNFGEVILISLCVIFNTPLALAPIQLLWINLITDGLPALALGVDPPERNVMTLPPKMQKELLHKRRWGFIIAEGSVIGISIFLLYYYALQHVELLVAQTIAFCTLAVSQLVHALNNRSTRLSLFQIGFFTNKSLVLALIISFVLQIFAVQTGIGNVIFKTRALTPLHWAGVLGISLIPFLFVEAKKLGLKWFKI